MAQFLEQYYSPSDLSQFQNNFKLPVQQPIKVVGDNDVNKCDDLSPSAIP